MYMAIHLHIGLLIENRRNAYLNEVGYRVREMIDDVNDERYCHMDEAADADGTGPADTDHHGTDERY